MNTEVGEPKEKNYFLVKKQSQNEKVIHCSSCNRNGRKHGFLRSESPEGRPGYGRDGTGSDQQVEAVEVETVTPESEIPAAAESQKTQPEQANNK